MAIALALPATEGSILSAAGQGAPPSADACRALGSQDIAQLPNPTTKITAARMHEATPAGQTPSVPRHCEVVGRLNERIGFNSQHFAVNFRLRLPSAWNGRFFFQGGGGTNGNVGTALGNLQGSQPANALALGYAVVSQDSGHDNVINNNPAVSGAQAFGFDPEARLDLGYRSYDEVTRLAKALIHAYYGRPPERSYYVGCSEGGREGLMMSQRFPDYFDGILSVAPGLNIPKAVAASVWDTQVLAALAKADGHVDRDGLPLLNKTFSDEQLALVSRAILDACDDLDGLADGLVEDQARCTSVAVERKLAALACGGSSQGTCLSAGQLEALRKMAAGPKDSRGTPLYAEWPWDPGIGGRSGNGYFQGWRAWKLGAHQAPENSALNVGFVATALGAVLSTPPVPFRAYSNDGLRYFLGYDLDTHAARVTASNALYPESVDSFMRANGTDLSAFKKRGGKLIVVHGAADPIFSLRDSIAWWEGVNTADGGNAASFVRLFNVPGMAHCAGGPATDQFDAFAAVVDWVEKGTAPDRIVATARAGTPWPGRTRPLCAHPAHARYTGTGSIEDARNFTCQAPRN